MCCLDRRSAAAGAACGLLTDVCPAVGQKQPWLPHTECAASLLFAIVRSAVGSSQALPAAREPRIVEAAPPSSIGDDHGAHLAVVKAAVHLLLHAQRALVPKGAQRQKDEAAVGDHSDATLRPAGVRCQGLSSSM